METKTMRIGEMADKAGVNVQTLRFYEKRGLLPDVSRTESRYRVYTDDALRRVRFIKRAQELGFSLEEIKELLALRIDSEATCADVRRQAEKKMADIGRRIETLRAMREALAGLTAACDGHGSTSDCSILDGLDPRDKEYDRGEAP